MCGIPARNIAYWDGSAWHALVEGIQGQVYALAFDPDGELHAAGLLTEGEGSPLTLQPAGKGKPGTRWGGEG